MQQTCIDDKIARCYEPIVRIAASRHSSTQASEMLQTFMQKMPVCFDVSKNIPTAPATPILNAVTAISGLSVSQAALFVMTTQDDVINLTSQNSSINTIDGLNSINTQAGLNSTPSDDTKSSPMNGKTSTFNLNSVNSDGDNNNNMNNEADSNHPSLRNCNSYNNFNHRRQISLPTDMNYESLENSSTVRKLVELTSDLDVELPKGESSLDKCLIMVPIDSIDNWDAEFVKEIREKLASIKVINYPFVWSAKYANEINALKLGDGQLHNLPIPEGKHTYYSYLSLKK